MIAVFVLDFGKPANLASAVKAIADDTAGPAGKLKGHGGSVHRMGGSALARSERFELPTLGFEVRCSIQLSYERLDFDYQNR